MIRCLSFPDQPSTTSADVYTTTNGSITSTITLQPSSSDSSTDSGLSTSTASSEIVYVTTTQTIIRSIKPRTFTSLRTNTLPFTTTLVLESPTTSSVLWSLLHPLQLPGLLSGNIQRFLLPERSPAFLNPSSA